MIKHIQMTLVGATAIAGGAVLLAMPVHAAEAEQGTPTVPDIIVTASKFGATSLARTAVTANVVGAAELANRNITSPGDLQTQVPGLITDPGSSSPKLTIRGVGHDQFGLGAENGVAVYIDGVLIGRTVGLLSPYNDLERAEVLKGPQGTSFGRNATGGAINYITKKPVDGFSGYANLQYGSFDRIRGGGAVNYGGDTVGVRVSGFYQKDDGFARNVFTGRTAEGGRKYTIRGIVDFRPSDDLSFEYLFDYANEHVDGPAEVVTSNIAQSRSIIFPTVVFRPFFPATLPSPLVLTPNKDYTFTNDLEPFQARRLMTNALTATLDLGAVTLKSITAYQRTKYDIVLDSDQGPLNILNVPFTGTRSKQLTQELVAAADLGALKLTVGGFYLRENARSFGQILLFITTPSGLSINRSNHQITKSYAGFIEARYSITDAVRVSGGLRYTKDRKTMDQSQALITGPATAMPGVTIPVSFLGSDSWSKLTFSGGVEADLSNNTFAFAKVSRGFKAGGFNDSAIGDTFEPETLTSYEAGVKGNFMNHRVTYALSGFYSKYSNIQVAVIQTGSFVTENAAKATIWGFDLQGKVDVSDALSFDAAVSYIPKAEYDSYVSADPFGATCGASTVLCDLSGNRLNRAPKFAGTFGMNFKQDIGDGRNLIARGELYRTSKISYSAFAYPASIEPGYTLINAYLSADITSHLSARLYGKNLTDKLYLGGRVANGTINHTFAYYGRPREFGAELNFTF